MRTWNAVNNDTILISLIEFLIEDMPSLKDAFYPRVRRITRKVYLICPLVCVVQVMDTTETRSSESGYESFPYLSLGMTELEILRGFSPVELF
jgi:hypothetical protein